MKKDLTNPLVIISLILVILVIAIFIKYYFVKPLFKEASKIEVSAEEKLDLKLLTKAYLNQNKNIAIQKKLFGSNNINEFAVAANYYYLKKGIDHLNEYDSILKVGRKIFNNKSLNFSNFEVNIDEKSCGKEKYTTLEGIIYNDECDKELLIYEIGDIYKQGNNYVVEFYASKAVQKLISSNKECDNYEKSVAYNLTLTDLENNEFFNELYSRCCLDNCLVEGIDSLKDDILKQMKMHNHIYKLVFQKNENDFVYDKLKK